MNLLTRPELASDTQAHEDHHEHDHGHEQGGMKVFGMWVYLMSDLVLFGSLFASYAVLSTAYAGGPTGKDLFSLPFVMAETFLLLVSSITYGQAVLAMHRHDASAVLRCGFSAGLSPSCGWRGCLGCFSFGCCWFWFWPCCSLRGLFC